MVQEIRQMCRVSRSSRIVDHLAKGCVLWADAVNRPGDDARKAEKEESRS
jgi:hypothetical protein